MKKLKKAKKSAQPATADPWKPKPVSIHLVAEGEHLQAAHDDLAKQLKPMGFSMAAKGKKKGKPGKSQKQIGDALSR